MLNVNLVTFTPKDTKAAGKGLATGATPGLATLNTPTLWLFLIGLLFAIVFTVLKLKGGMLLTIVITAIIGIPMGLTSMSNSVSISDTFAQLPQTFGVIFSADASRRCSPTYPTAARAGHDLRVLDVRHVRHARHVHRHRPPHRHLLR